MKIKKAIYPIILAPVAFVILAIPVVLFRTGTVAATDSDFSNGITVDSVADDADFAVGDGVCNTGSGDCTLRAALQEANSDPDVTIIDFAITPFDGSVKTITPSTALPQITSPVSIDGFTQDDATPNTTVFPAPMDAVMRIELSGAGMALNNVVGSGLDFQDGSDGSTVKGLTINRFTDKGIFVEHGADGVAIRGCYVGTDPTGLINRGNIGSGLSTEGTGFGVGGPVNGVIGSSNPADRNIFSGNSSHANDPNMVIGSQGLAIVHGSNGWVIQGNYVGVGADGATAIPNELGGITIDYIQNLKIGGDQVGEGNIFSGNGDGGVQPDGVDGLIMQGNLIGTDYTGNNPVPNGTKGVTLAYGTKNALIGGTTQGAKNIIAYNTWFGINVWQAETNDITIIGNSIHDNAGGLGIDLSNLNSGGGNTPNDALDADVGANDYLNYPEYKSFSEVSGNTNIEYQLDVPAGDYRIEFYSNTTTDPSGYGEGETYLGAQNVTSLGAGVQNFAHTLNGITGVTNLAMTVTELDDSTDGFGATSEFGAQAVLVSDLSISKSLVSPEAVAAGAHVAYTVNLKNSGPDTYNLSQQTTPFTATPLFYDVTPADLTLSDLSSPGPFPGVYSFSSGNQDLDCYWAEQGSAATLLGTIDHPDYGFVACWYAGTDYGFVNQEELSATIHFTIDTESNLDFANYAIIPPTENDPHSAVIIDAADDGGDTLTAYLRLRSEDPGFNNISVDPLPADITLTSEVINPPATIDSGTSISLQVSIANNGPATFNINNYTSMALPLFAGAYPATDLTFVGVEGDLLRCTDLGQGTVSYLGAAGEEHTGYALLPCVGNSAVTIAPGQAKEFTLHFVAKPGVGTNLKFYTLNTSAAYDPDVGPLSVKIYTATGDVLDSIENNNFTSAQYMGSRASSVTSMSGGLGATGQDSGKLQLMGLVAVICSLTGVLVYFLRRKK